MQWSGVNMVVRAALAFPAIRSLLLELYPHFREANTRHGFHSWLDQAKLTAERRTLLIASCAGLVELREFGPMRHIALTRAGRIAARAIFEGEANGARQAA